MLDLSARRQLLLHDANPSGRIDYVVSLSGPIPGDTPPFPARLSLRYVPDRLILRPDCLKAYLAALRGMEWSALEALAVTVMDDFNNELVPRWILVAIHHDADRVPAIDRHAIVLEDRQPRWDNRRLLDRLEKC